MVLFDINSPFEEDDESLFTFSLLILPSPGGFGNSTFVWDLVSLAEDVDMLETGELEDFSDKGSDEVSSGLRGGGFIDDDCDPDGVEEEDDDDDFEEMDEIGDSDDEGDVTREEDDDDGT